MARTYSEIIDLIESILIDAGIDPDTTTNETFAAAELDAWIEEALLMISRYRPRIVKYTLTPVASTRDITLTAEHKRNMIESRLNHRVEYYPSGYSEASYTERVYHNFEKVGDVITLAVDALPAGTETIYIWIPKKHILQKTIGTVDVDAAMNSGAVLGATSINLKSLGTGTINEHTQLTISPVGGPAHTYTVISQATIAGNAATVSIYPGLTFAASEDDPVTLALADSTLDIELEEYLAKYAAAQAAINKARSFVGVVNVGSNNPANLMIGWGMAKLQDVTGNLRSLAKIEPYKEYAR